MRRSLDSLSTREVLALAVRLEEASAERFRAFAASFRGYDEEVAERCLDLSREAHKHARLLRRRYRERFEGKLVSIDPSEVAGLAEVMDLEGAEDQIFGSLEPRRFYELALKAQEQAHDFYQRAAERAEDPETASLYREIAALAESHDLLATLRLAQRVLPQAEPQGDETPGHPSSAVHGPRSPRMRRTVRLFFSLLVVVAAGTAGFLAASDEPEPTERFFTMRLRQYGYSPSVLRVHRGDTVRLRLISEDVEHGFYLEGHDLDARVIPLQPEVELRHPSEPDVVERVEEVVFTADREGKFRFRCSRTCGYMHPFMLGELVVAPNRLFSTGVGLSLGLLLGGLVLVSRKGDRA